jgi:diguanylate cyclase (GGDEF)-like protein
LKQWVKKLLDQLDMDWEKNTPKSNPDDKSAIDINEDRATLLFLLDTYNKHLIETDKQPVRKVREILDNFAKALVSPEASGGEKVLFQLRQFFSSHRLDEYTYVQNTFDDFKRIIWDFADQLSEDIRFEQLKDEEAKGSFEQLREAVESNSIDELRNKSREFIDFYIKYQSQKTERRSKRMTSIRKNLNVVKKQLVEANESMRTDHLTAAYNRMSFDEQLKKHHKLFEMSHAPVTLIMLDIDFFKKINDAYGHDMGDFVLKECVRLLKESFHREEDFLARVGGEEFAILLPDMDIAAAVNTAEHAMAKIRKEVFVHGKLDIRFTVSMGIAQLTEQDSADSWLKRADTALYQSKNTGRNKYTVAPPHGKIASVA